MSGTGKSTVIEELGRRGHRVVDTDDAGWGEDVPLPDGAGFERLWRPDRMHHLLGQDAPGRLFVSGCTANQRLFYDRFDAVVLLTVAPEILLHRLEVRSNNPFGKDAAERRRILDDLENVEPLLRRSATRVVDTDQPLDRVVDAVETIALDAG
jgi:hypothetical protein